MNTHFKYLAFINTNNIVLHMLPKELQNRIRGIEDWVDQLKHTTLEDRKQLEMKIERLDLELEEDLYEYYEDRLCNNELCEIPQKKKKNKKKISVFKPKPELKVETIRSLSKNEHILKSLYETGKTTNLNRSFLLKLGMSKSIGLTVVSRALILVRSRSILGEKTGECSWLFPCKK